MKGERSRDIEKAMADIFISYAREDREIAKALAQALEDQGWSVWWDRHIPPGRRFRDVIQSELTATRCVIAVWSTAASDSPWVLEEAQEGLDRNILVVPARIENVQLPIGFRTIQTADLSDWNGNPAHLGFIQLAEEIRSVLGEPSEDSAPKYYSYKQFKKIEGHAQHEVWVLRLWYLLEATSFFDVVADNLARGVKYRYFLDPQFNFQEERARLLKLLKEDPRIKDPDSFISVDDLESTDVPITFVFIDPNSKNARGFAIIESETGGARFWVEIAEKQVASFVARKTHTEHGKGRSRPSRWWKFA